SLSAHPRHPATTTPYPGPRGTPLPQPSGCHTIATVGLLLARGSRKQARGRQLERLPGQCTIPDGHELKGCSSMSTKEETTATTVRALNDALNARDRSATVALFASDGVFHPGAAGATF